MPRRTVGTFSIPYLQVLDEQGALDRELEPELGEEALVAYYRAMVLGREVDQRMLKLQRQGRIGTFPLNTGQEAAAVGVALAMADEDWMVPAFREVPAMLLRGVPIEKILAAYAGYEEGSHLPETPRTLPLSIPVGSQILHAPGLAYAMRMRGEERTAVVSFFGDGATSEGDFHEALNFAGVWGVPVVFVCLNNQWAISLPRDQQTASETIAQKAIAYGIEGIQVDGNDPLAVYAAAVEALERARETGKPTLIEAVTYRLMQHTTSDDPKKYRDAEEEQRWWARDPIPRMRAYLERKGFWDDAREERLQAEIKAEIDAAVQRFEARLEVAADTPFEYVYADGHANVREQREAFLATLPEEARDGQDEHGAGDQPGAATGDGTGRGGARPGTGRG